MKILYAIQGTGNGHLSRARDIIPLLKEKAELDILISGVQADVELPYEVKYRFKGLSFIFGKKGGVDLWKTYHNSNTKNLIKEIRSLPVSDYDLIINDFEPVSAWAAKVKGVPCISLSHQSAVMSKYAPKPNNTDWIGKTILKNYAPCSGAYGFHFDRFDKNIFTPVIRKQIREITPTNEGHYTVYLPAYKDELLIKALTKFPKIKWQVFSKHNKVISQVRNVLIRPIDNNTFIESLVSSNGVLCGAGFETPAEALFLKKKLMVIPMKNQYEQACNAAALEAMGVPVIKSLKKKHHAIIQEWVEKGQIVDVFYPDITKSVIDLIIDEHSQKIKTNDASSNKFLDTIDRIYASLKIKHQIPFQAANEY
jgi:uncharacterized protein (TIGR00661 family)